MANPLPTTLDEALRFLVDEFALADFIYEARSRAVDAPDYEEGKDSWEQPLVQRFAAAEQIITAHVRAQDEESAG